MLIDIEIAKKTGQLFLECAKQTAIQAHNQKEFARLLEISAITLSTRLERGEYKDLYIMVGASRKFNTKKVKRFLRI